MILLDEPLVDGYGTITIAEACGYLVQIMPMLYNDRLVLTPACCPEGYDYGWCYKKGPAATLAAMQWDPANEGEPPGFIKAVHRGRLRRPGERHSHG